MDPKLAGHCFTRHLYRDTLDVLYFTFAIFDWNEVGKLTGTQLPNDIPWASAVMSVAAALLVGTS
jgi:hypothetical protein